jgi:hypothetical protein
LAKFVVVANKRLLLGDGLAFQNRSSIEELHLNLALQPIYFQTVVSSSLFFLISFIVIIFLL